MAAKLLRGDKLLPVVVQGLEQLEGLAFVDGLAPCGLFGCGKICFKAGIGVGKAAANGRSQLDCRHLCSTQAADPQSVTAEALPRDGYDCGCSAGIAVE